MSNLRSEGTLVQQNEKTFWFKNDLTGQVISPPQAILLLEGMVRRKLSSFETKLLISRPVDGSTNITIVGMLLMDGSETNYLKSIQPEVVAYIVRRREKSARFNYGDVIGSDAVYSIAGTLLGQVKVTRKQEPGLETPLLDPIDFAGGALADIVTAGVKAGARALVGSFRAAIVSVEEKLLVREATNEAAAGFRVLTKEELSMVWGGGAAKPLTDREMETAIALLRNGHDVHVESIAQMRQIQGELGQVGVRSQNSSNIIPQRLASSTVGRDEVAELPGSFKAGRGTYKVDKPHGVGKVPYNPHNEYHHINITLRDGKKLAVIVTGSKSF